MSQHFPICAKFSSPGHEIEIYLKTKPPIHVQYVTFERHYDWCSSPDEMVCVCLCLGMRDTSSKGKIPMQ